MDEGNAPAVYVTMPDPRNLTQEDWQNIKHLAQMYMEEGETNPFKIAVMAYFDYVGLDQTAH